MIKKIKTTTLSVLKKHRHILGFDIEYFAWGGFWTLIRQTIFFGSGVALSAAYARLLSKEIFGEYQLILSIFTVLSFFSVTGISYSLIQSVSRGFDGDYEDSTSFRLRSSLWGSMALVLVGLYFVFQNRILGTAFILSALFFPAFYAYNNWDSLLQGKKKFDTASYYSSALILLNTSIVLVAILIFPDNLLVATLSYLASYSLVNLYFFIRTRRYVKNVEKDGETIRYGVVLTKISLLVLIAENIDKIILGVLVDPVTLAAYYFVSLVPVRAKDLANPFLNLLLPKLSVSEISLKELIRKKKRAILSALIASLVFAIAYYFLIEKANRLFFGNRYGDVYPLSRYYVLFFLTFLPLGIATKMCQAGKKEKIIKISDTSYSLVKIVLSVMLILRFGLLGAVVAYNVSALVWLVLYIINIKLHEKD